jgi:putative heme-binding domain-containing protein
MRCAKAVVRALLGLAFVMAAPALRAQAPAPDHSGQDGAAVLATGQRVYATLCAACHGPTGNGVANVDLRRGPLPRASTEAALRDVIANGLPQTGMPSFRMEPAELDGVVAFVRSGLDAGPTGPGPELGDAARGRAVFEIKGQCLACHRLFDAGMFSGPDLSDIGRLRQPAAIQRSLLDPTGSMQPINRPVRAVLRDGTVVTGRRLNEDLVTVQLITHEGRLVSLVKPELREWTVSTTSTMPSYRNSLSTGELADLLAFLVSLKGTRP